MPEHRPTPLYVSPDCLKRLYTKGWSALFPKIWNTLASPQNLLILHFISITIEVQTCRRGKPSRSCDGMRWEMTPYLAASGYTRKRKTFCRLMVNISFVMLAQTSKLTSRAKFRPDVQQGTPEEDGACKQRHAVLRQPFQRACTWHILGSALAIGIDLLTRLD